MSNQEEHRLMQEDSDADEVSEQNDEYSDEVMQSTWHKHFVIIPPGFLVKHFFFSLFPSARLHFPKGRGYLHWRSFLRQKTELWRAAQLQKRHIQYLKESSRKYSCTETCLQYPHQRTLWPGGGRDETRCLSCLNSPTHTCVSKHHLLHMREFFPQQGTQLAKRGYIFYQIRQICRFFYRKTVKTQYN